MSATQYVAGLVRYAKPRTTRRPGHNALTPQRYVVGWHDAGIVKVGSTTLGRQRWGAYLSRGATMLDLGYFNHAVTAEIYMQTVLAAEYPRAFKAPEQAIPYLGTTGSGYTECFRVPPADWGIILEIAQEV